MKISIVTVCWNSEKHLKDAIVSVLSQTYPHIEYIVVDGGSTDRTIDIIKEYEPFFRGRMKWISEKDNGLYDAMNKGIQMASGDVIGFINSDDFFIDENSVANVLQIFDEKNVDSVFTDLYYVKENDTDAIVRKWITGERKSFTSGWHPPHPAFFVKKKVYDDFGLFDLKYKIAADFEIMLRFLEKYKISSFYLQVFTIKMRLGGASNRSFKNIRQGNREIRDAFRKNNIAFPFYYTSKRWFRKILQYI